MRKMMLTAKTRALYLGTALALLSSTAFAQVPTSVDPSKVEGRFNDRLAPQSTGTATAVPELPSAQTPSSKEASKRFTLKSVAIDGATVYTQEQLTPLFADVLGKEVSIAEARSLAEKISLKYRNDGYILSQAVIPDQKVSDGTLRIRVIEGFISNVVIQGDVRDSRATTLVASYGEKIKAHKPLNIADLERYLLLMDDLPGATAKGVVKPSANTFGAADLVITIEHKMLEGSLSVDNRGSKFIGPYQFTGTAAVNSLFNLYDRTNVRLVTTGDTEELQFIDLQHEQQIGREGTRALISGSHSRTRPGFTLKPSDVEGLSNSVEAKIVHPFIRSRTKNLTGRASVDYRNTDTDLSGLPLSNDRLTSARIGAAYDSPDFLGGVSLVDAQFSHGLDIFNPSESGAARSRPQGQSDYSKINLDLSRTQPLPFAGLSLFTAATSQYAFDKLLASEQFAIGGPAFGSAYDPAELSGDTGVAGRAELRYGRAANLRYLDSYQAYGFYDIGKVWTRGAGGDQSLASTGLGIRTNFTSWLSGSGEAALPLTKDVSTKGDQDARFFFSLTGRF